MFFRRQNWNVVGWLKTVSTVSTIVIVAGIIAMGYTWSTTGKPLRLGLSFTGGTNITVKFKSPVSAAAVRAAMESIGAQDVNVDTLARAGDAVAGERYTISTQTDFGNTKDKVNAALAKIAPVDAGQSQFTSVGPALSREYLIKALEALVIAIGIQFVYIAFRFGWNYIFGAVTVIALVRDALMMIGIYALAGRRADDAFLAAVLTVIGYSVMDTIVILDRIRENTKLMIGESYEKIVNTSILQTMTRSINTLATVVITLVALLALGGASLRNFAFALLVGICSGGYHSIFFSAPLVNAMRERQLASAAKKRAEGKIVEGERPRSVAEARAQAKDREAVLAARRERREREKTSARKTSGPARYRKGRAQIPAALDELEADQDEMDPLDAQSAGLHDEQLALGHEELHLALEDDTEPAVHGAGEQSGERPAARE